MSNVSELLAKAIEKKRSYRSASRNNYITYDNGIITVRYYNTDIAVIDLDERTITLNTGGWTTPTTKERMNEVLDTMGINNHIWQEKWIWYYGRWDGKRAYHFDGMKIEFTTGDILNPEEGPDIDTEEKARKLFNRLLSRYVRKFKRLAGRQELPDPAGDCLYCSMIDEHEGTHLYSHLIEEYVMQSLVYNALVKAGYNADFLLAIYRDADASNTRESLFTDTAARAIKKYFRQRIVKVKLLEAYEQHRKEEAAA